MTGLVKSRIAMVKNSFNKRAIFKKIDQGIKEEGNNDYSLERRVLRKYERDRLEAFEMLTYGKYLLHHPPTSS